MATQLRVAAVAALLLGTGCNFTQPIELPPPLEVSTPSGVLVLDMLPGEGAQAELGDHVSIHYVGRTQEGTLFDDSRDRGEPLKFTLGEGVILPAWEEGLIGMRAGGQRRLTIPPELAYGDEGHAGIPPGATLVLVVDLVELQSADRAP